MDTKTSVILGTGMTVATIVGISVAVMQNRPAPNNPINQTDNSTPTLAPSPSGIVAQTSPSPANSPIPSHSPQRPSPPQTAAPEPNTPESPRPSPDLPLRQVERCVITMAKVADPNPPLNVRSGPVVAPDNIMTQLPNNTYVTVVAEQEGWLQIKTPVAGWIAKNRTDSACSLMTVRVNFAPGSSKATISDRFVGTGNHRYLIAARQGQTITITTLDPRSPLPTVVTSAGRSVLLPQDNQTSLTGTLPQTGDYALEIDSNFKGFDYTFSVELR